MQDAVIAAEILVGVAQPVFVVVVVACGVASMFVFGVGCLRAYRRRGISL